MKVFKNAQAGRRFLDSYDNLLQQWHVDYEELDVVGKYGTTHCIVAGDPKNKPVMLLHGVGDNSAVMWLLNIQVLAEHFYCVAVDTLGGPGKSKPNEIYEQAFEQVEWLTSLLDHLGMAEANMIGVSNGAYMAYNYCVKHPERVAKAVCIEGGFIQNPLKAVWGTISLLFPEILWPTKANMRKILFKMASPQSPVFVDHPDIVDHMIQAMKVHNRNAMFKHKIEKYVKEEGVRQKDKLLFLLGDYRLAEKAPFVMSLERGGYRYQVISQAGHGLNMEQPELVHRAILDFLEPDGKLAGPQAVQTEAL